MSVADIVVLGPRVSVARAACMAARIVAARSERLRARGEDPFGDYMLPEAVLRFKQGFGRLIRSRADRGAILILDRRVLTKGYGRLFLESLPPARLVRGPLAEVLCAIGEACRGAETKPA